DVLAEACGVVRLRRARSVEIQAETVESAGGAWTTREPLRVGGAKARGRLPGERLCARGPLVPARPGRDEAPLLAARDVRVQEGGSRIRLAAASVRREFSQAARRALPRTQAGLLLGMTDGDVELVDEQTMEAFRTTGLAHLVAVSGSNVAVVLVIVMLVSRALIPRGRWLRVAVAVPVLVFFAFLTGLEASVLRAVFMAGVALAIAADGRLADAVRVSCFAFIALVLVAPEMLAHPGFQLSFGATLGLILWAGPLTDRIGRYLPESRLGRAAAAATATTLAAQAAVAPLLAWHFGRVPAFGGIANLLVAPLAPVVMIGGSLTLGVASVFSSVEWLPATMRLPLDAILLSARWFSRVPAASLDANVLTGVAVTAAVAAFLAHSRRSRVVATTIVVAAVAAATGRAVARSSFECPAAGVHALDVGQGTAVLLEAGGRAVLFDAGRDDGAVVRQLEELGIDHLDAIVVSHPHADHALGAVSALEKLDVDAVYGPVTLGWGSGGDVIRAARSASVRVQEVAAGHSLTAGGIRLDVLWPEPGPAPPFSEDLVDPYSLVMRARLGGVDVLLPADIRAEQQSELAETDVRAPLMIAVHHGSKNLDADFVDAVAPKLTLVTVGAPNPYGLPAPEALRAYSRHGSVFRTDQDGRVSVCLDDGRAEVVTQR
ncbi:MAG: DNA internalization-related competence protein ComEC/Rec2, partial [Actinomycetota bacterium]